MQPRRLIVHFQGNASLTVSPKCDITFYAPRDKGKGEKKKNQACVMCLFEQSGSSHHIKSVIYVIIQECLPGESESSK